jgi:hypothetical protein
MKGGRPPMAPNRLSRKRAMQLCADKESPLDVMFDNMLFWHRQSRDLGAKLDAICGKIKNEDDRREAMSLARMFLSARENAQRCAVDCAPYVHARLQAVHHEHGPTGRYIISDRPLTEAEGSGQGRRDRRHGGEVTSDRKSNGWRQIGAPAGRKNRKKCP